MEKSSRPRCQSYAAVKAPTQRKRLGFGAKPALTHIELQKASTIGVECATACQTDPPSGV